jgi:hypothetical protein
MTATYAEIMQAAGNLHDHIRHTGSSQPQDIFDNPTPFHTGNHVFDDDADTRDQMIEELVSNAQLLPARFFLGCWVLCFRPARVNLDYP